MDAETVRLECLRLAYGDVEAANRMSHFIVNGLCGEAHNQAQATNDEIPFPVQQAEKEFSSAMELSGFLGDAVIRDILLRLYDRACDDQAQREGDQSALSSVRDTSFSGLHQRAWQREQRANAERARQNVKDHLGSLRQRTDGPAPGSQHYER